MLRSDAVLDALGDPTRRRVLALVRAGSRSVTEVAAELPVSRPAVSQHLAVLHAAGLVKRQVVGREHRYRADPTGFAVLRAYLESYWNTTLAAFAAAADAGSQEP